MKNWQTEDGHCKRNDSTTEWRSRRSDVAPRTWSKLEQYHVEPGPFFNWIERFVRWQVKTRRTSPVLRMCWRWLWRSRVCPNTLRTWTSWDSRKVRQGDEWSQTRSSCRSTRKSTIKKGNTRLRQRWTPSWRRQKCSGQKRPPQCRMKEERMKSVSRCFEMIRRRKNESVSCFST